MALRMINFGKGTSLINLEKSAYPIVVGCNIFYKLLRSS